MKVIVAGSRRFNNYRLMQQKLDRILSSQPKVEIVSGGNGYYENGELIAGADAFGEQYARSKGYPVKQFLPDWDTHGK